MPPLGHRAEFLEDAPQEEADKTAMVRHDLNHKTGQWILVLSTRRPGQLFCPWPPVLYWEDAFPDEILDQVLSFLPPKAFLPIANVCKRFRRLWMKQRAAVCANASSAKCRCPCSKDMSCCNSARMTNPLQLGNLFQSQWNNKLSSNLSTSLLEYYVSCGWNDPVLMQRVMRESAARGDIPGMMHLVDRSLVKVGNVDVCTVAGAAGHLEALRWLREQKQWPWDPSEVIREASENLHSVAVMTYVELNSAGYEIKSPSYGDGLPW